MAIYSVDEIDTDEESGRLRSKTWVESIRYSKYTIKKNEEKQKEYQKLMLLIGLKKKYSKDNKFKLRQLTIVAPDLIRVIHEKKEKRQNKEIKTTKTVTIKKPKEKPVTIESILDKFKNEDELTKEETKRVDMYIRRKEFEASMKQRMEERKEIGKGAR